MLTRQEITEKLKDILLFADPNGAEKIEKATEDAVLTSDLGFSSVSILYMVIAIEEAFGIEFEGVTLQDFETLGDVITYIERKLPR